ncbi:acyl-CoA desaturase [Paraburkholderia dinghuensis]|uniref:Acyl-CoA desaturase n=2 Tax=Paraburkholderia dinghuensis TaxID=2305225 RepID=A0A3N6N9D0_9BURK|nr:acyl-CoA desaturase [Paraburkholderia dinghuensis]
MQQELLIKPAFLTSRHSSFADELRVEAGAYLKGRADHRYGNTVTALKAVMFGILALVLFFVSLRSTSGVVFVCVYVGFYVSAVLLSVNVSHDAAHGALFPSRTLNGIAMRVVTLPLGIEPVYWKVRHVRYHHPNANIEHHDLDTEANRFLRQTPFQAWYPQFRFQQYYWPLVAGLSMPYIAWIFDWSDRLGLTPLAKDRLLPGLGGWLKFVGSKLAHLGLFLILPLVVVAPSTGYGPVIAAYVLGQMAASCLVVMLILGTHWADTHFYDVSDGAPLPHTREEHAFLTCCDWAARPHVLNGCLGGLNLHLTHHLFPMFSHRHYPELASIVERLAKRHGLPYRCLRYRELLDAQRRFLESMGKRPDTQND